MPTNPKKPKRAKRLSEMQEPSPWSRRGVEDVYFQREAQVNFWTVMGGVAAAALLTQVDALWMQLQAGRWYLVLYFINSMLSIVLSWSLLSWGSLVLKYPITIPSILLLVLSTFAVALQCLLVTRPEGWLAAATLAGLANWMHQIYFMRMGAWEIFSLETVERLKKNLWVYGLWPLLGIVGAVHMYLVPTAIIQTVWGVIVLTIIINALFRQHHGMEREKKELGIP